MIKQLLSLTFILGMSSATLAAPPVASGVSHASAIAVETSVLGTVISVGLVAYGSGYVVGETGKTSLDLLDAGLEVASEVTVVSAELVGDSVIMTYQMGIEGTQLSAELGQDVLFFTTEVLASTLTAAGWVIEDITSAVINGTQTALNSAAIIAYESGPVLGYALSLATYPDLVLCLILTDAGRSLFGSTTL